MVLEDNQQQNNSTALKTAWAILIIATITMAFDVFFIRNNYLHSVSQQKFLTLVESQKDEITQLNVQILLTIQDTNYISSIFKRDLLSRYSVLKNRNDSFLNPKFTDGLNAELLLDVNQFHQKLQKVHDDFFGVSKLVLDKNKGALENKELIIEQLSEKTMAYTDLLYQLQKWSIQQTNKFSSRMYQVLTLTTGLFIVLAIIGYIFIIIPFRSNQRSTTSLLVKWRNEIDNQVKIAKDANHQKETFDLKLKTQTAQLLKLQKSLNVSIEKIKQANNEKNLIYYNIGTDLTEYLKIIGLQLSILESQPKFENNTQWVSLTTTVSHLNQMAIDYYNLAKLGHHEKQSSVVYLSQLISEMVISGSNNKGIKFQQISDMPSITTNETLLKRALLPYIEIMTDDESINETIRVSAKESESICEIKFMGLPSSFEKTMTYLSSASISDYSIQQFKVHMSNKTIEERGGKQWHQFDVGQKGVFTVHWTL